MAFLFFSRPCSCFAIFLGGCNETRLGHFFLSLILCAAAAAASFWASIAHDGNNECIKSQEDFLLKRRNSRTKTERHRVFISNQLLASFFHSFFYREHLSRDWKGWGCHRSYATMRLDRSPSTNRPPPPFYQPLMSLVPTPSTLFDAWCVKDGKLF